jgi:YidC/Oxa1 family membrane protein insertase
VGPARTLAPNTQVSNTTRLFAGAKRVSVLESYEQKLAIPRFDSAVDWGTCGS